MPESRTIVWACPLKELLKNRLDVFDSGLLLGIPRLDTLRIIVDMADLLLGFPEYWEGMPPYRLQPVLGEVIRHYYRTWQSANPNPKPTFRLIRQYYHEIWHAAQLLVAQLPLNTQGVGYVERQPGWVVYLALILDDTDASFTGV